MIEYSRTSGLPGYQGRNQASQQLLRSAAEGDSVTGKEPTNSRNLIQFHG